LDSDVLKPLLRPVVTKENQNHYYHHPLPRNQKDKDNWLNTVYMQLKANKEYKASTDKYFKQKMTYFITFFHIYVIV
jgi:ABC-type amino acid transport substrate-binding protein